MAFLIFRAIFKEVFGLETSSEVSDPGSYLIFQRSVHFETKYTFFKKMGQNLPIFVYFRFFSHRKNKCSTNLTINDKA